MNHKESIQEGKTNFFDYLSAIAAGAAVFYLIKAILSVKADVISDKGLEILNDKKKLDVVDRKIQEAKSASNFDPSKGISVSSKELLSEESV